MDQFEITRVITALFPEVGIKFQYLTSGSKLQNENETLRLRQPAI